MNKELLEMEREKGKARGGIYYKTPEWFSLPEPLKKAMWLCTERMLKSEGRECVEYRYWFKNDEGVWVYHGTPARGFVIDEKNKYRALDSNKELIGVIKKEAN